MDFNTFPDNSMLRFASIKQIEIFGYVSGKLDYTTRQFNYYSDRNQRVRTLLLWREIIY